MKRIKYVMKLRDDLIEKISELINKGEADSVSSYIELAIQNQLHTRNNMLPAIDKVLIRIGLHTGEVVAIEGDLFGNQVNLCSRIESIAVESSIACSNTFHENISNIHSRCYGYVKLKNIPQPEKIYRIYNNELGL